MAGDDRRKKDDNTFDYAKLKETKVTLPVVAILGFVWLGYNANGIGVDYLDDFFITKALAEEQYTIITEQVTETRTLVVTHINEYKLNENAKETRDLTNAIYDLELYVAANGASGLTNDRKRDLENQMQRLARVRSCIVRNAQIPHNSERKPENCDAIV